MGSASLARRDVARDPASELTGGESSFRNPKLRDAVLIVYKAIADAASKGAFFVITIIAARRLTPYAFGVFALGTTVGWMLAVLTDFGMQMHLSRAVASRPQIARALLRRWWRLRVASASAGLAVFVIACVVGRVDRALTLPLTLFATAYLLTSLVEFINYYYRGLSRTDLESTLTLGQRALTLVLAVTVLYWRPDVNLLALALAFPAIASLAWSIVWVGRLDGGAESGRAADAFVADVLPIGLGIVLSALYFRIDVFLVQLWLGAEAVGRYNAVFRFVDAVRLFPAAVLAVTLPWLCRARDYRALAGVTSFLFVFAAAAASAIWIGASSIVTLLFGSQYRTAAPALRILALALPLLSANLALTHQLIGWNRQQAFAAICAAALAVNLGLNVFLIPAFAIEGAAWATVGTEICVTAGCVFALRGRP
jgi:O-antigen/teichoic acid export membrane protein